MREVDQCHPYHVSRSIASSVVSIRANMMKLGGLGLIQVLAPLIGLNQIIAMFFFKKNPDE